jgi:hypothetical protein
VKINDLSKAGEVHRVHIEWLAAEGITIPDKDGNYNPTNKVNRGAMAEFMYKLAGSPGAIEVGSATLAHVPASEVAAQEKKLAGDKDLAKLKTSNPNRYYDILWLAKVGITTGSNSAGTLYSPNKSVTRGQMADFMKKLAQYMKVA